MGALYSDENEIILNGFRVAAYPFNRKIIYA